MDNCELMEPECITDEIPLLTGPDFHHFASDSLQEDTQHVSTTFFTEETVVEHSISDSNSHVCSDAKSADVCNIFAFETKNEEKSNSFASDTTLFYSEIPETKMEIPPSTSSDSKPVKDDSSFLRDFDAFKHLKEFAAYLKHTEELPQEFHFLQHQLLEVGTWHGIVLNAVDEGNLSKWEEIIDVGQLLYIELPGIKDLSKERPIKLGVAEQLLNEEIVDWIEGETTPCKRDLQERLLKAHRWIIKSHRPPFLQYLRLCLDESTFTESLRLMQTLLLNSEKLNVSKNATLSSLVSPSTEESLGPTSLYTDETSRIAMSDEDGCNEEGKISTTSPQEKKIASDTNRFSLPTASISRRRRGNGTIKMTSKEIFMQGGVITKDSSNLDVESGRSIEEEMTMEATQRPSPAEVDELCSTYQIFRLQIPYVKHFENLNMRWKKWQKRFKRAMDGSPGLAECLVVLQEAASLNDVLDISSWMTILQAKVKDAEIFNSRAQALLSRVYGASIDGEVAKSSFSVISLESLKKKSTVSTSDIQVVLSLPLPRNRADFSELVKLKTDH
ncbi:PLU-1 family protein, partial [Cardiosporidium cionae]